MALFYDGQAVAEQKPAQQITLMNAQNEALVLYLDDNTHLPIKKSFSWRDPTDKQRNVEDEVYDNYRPVQGVMTPFDVTRYFNGEMSNQRFLNSVKYNQNLNPSLFTASITYGSDTPPKHKNGITCDIRPRPRASPARFSLSESATTTYLGRAVPGVLFPPLTVSDLPHTISAASV